VFDHRAIIYQSREKAKGFWEGRGLSNPVCLWQKIQIPHSLELTIEILNFNQFGKNFLGGNSLLKGIALTSMPSIGNNESIPFIRHSKSVLLIKKKSPEIDLIHIFLQHNFPLRYLFLYQRDRII